MEPSWESKKSRRKQYEFIDPRTGLLMVRIRAHEVPQSQLAVEAKQMELIELAKKYNVTPSHMAITLSRLGIRKLRRMFTAKVAKCFQVRIPSGFRYYFKPGDLLQVAAKETDEYIYLTYRLKKEGGANEGV